jgi:4-hydroxy-3-polyprenylbenzoate decarboxylase
MYHDLREWMKLVGELGQLREVRGADWNLELGTLADLNARRGDKGWALVFDGVKDYPAGYRIATGLNNSRERLAVSLGMEPHWPSEMAFVQAWREKIAAMQLVAPKVVTRGPILENEYSGDKVNMLKFPVPRWHEKDGGRYIGTGCLVITRDPDTGWINAGTYRVMVHDERHLAVYISPGHHGFLHRQRYFAQGKPCPVAICFGMDPLLLIPGGSEVEFGVSEYDYAGGIRGAPIEVIEGSVTGLPFPAAAEIVVEGELTDQSRKPEGPFGEFTGYYASGKRDECVFEVKRLLHRNDPIITGTVVSRPPHDNCLVWSRIKSGMIWNDLEKAGVPNVRGVWYHQAGQRFWLVISIQQRYAGHAKHTLGIASQCRNSAYMGRFIIVVDDDIDPSNTDDVLWALATRCDPASDIDIMRDCWSGPLDPIIHPDHKGTNSKALVNACRPWSWRNRFPEVAEPTPELCRTVGEKYAELLGLK